LLLAGNAGRSADLQTLDQLSDQLDELLPELMKEHHTPGVSIAIVRSRQLAVQRCFGVRNAESKAPVDRDTLFEAASMSKPLFAASIMLLVEQKQIDLDRPLVEYLNKPYLPDEPLHQKITARMVLQHTSGFPNWRQGGWRAGGPLPVMFEPGSKFGYSGEGFWYLQQVVEQITGERLEPWIQRIVLQPIGMKRSSFVWRDDLADSIAAGHDASGKTKTTGKRFERENAAFSLFTTPSDYSQFLIAMMAAQDSRTSLLRRETLDTMLQRTIATNKPQVWRGLGWAISMHGEEQSAWHDGTNGTGFKCYSRLEPATGNGIVIMTNAMGGESVWKKLVEKFYGEKAE
jgi:CubicO group peptidase (beta-lactamase class C family)